MIKSLLLTSSILISVLSANAQCSELFISEYVEGTFFNKALELYNPTGNPIDLSTYRLIRWDNGSTDADLGGDGILQLSGTINPYDVFVVVVNTTLQGQETPPDTALAAKADAFYGTSCIPGTGVIRTLCFNGDDAISLQKQNGASWINVDIFGSIGERPSNSDGSFSPTAGWTDIAPYSSIPAGYDGSVPYFFRYWTLDQTLKRKSDVVTGVTTNPEPETFNPSIEWDTLAENFFDSLGFHSCSCNLASVFNPQDGRKISVYPVPANDMVTVSAEEKIVSAELFDVSGKHISFFSTAINPKLITIETHAIPNGVYQVKLNFTKGQPSFRKLMVVH